jgi:hypothetical protein
MKHKDFNQTWLLSIYQYHGVPHNYGGDSFFQKDKSCVIPKLWLKSILLFYKNLLEIKSCDVLLHFERKRLGI